MGYHFPNILTDPTIQGAVSAGTGLTMPDFNAGNVSIGANKLLTSNLCLSEIGANDLGIMDSAKASWKSLYLGYLRPALGISAYGNPMDFDTREEDGAYVRFRARDTGVGLVEVARLQGAAEPHILLAHPKIGSVASLPTASADFRGFTYRVEGGAGITDYLYCCMKSAADTYNWIQIATGG